MNAHLPDEQLDEALDTTIAGAVRARVESEVLRALSGDEVLSSYVAAALTQPIEVPSRGPSMRKRETTYLHETVTKAIQAATKTAIGNVIEEEREEIEDLVRKAIKRRAGDIASGIAESISDRAGRGYGITVDLRLPGDNAF